MEGKNERNRLRISPALLVSVAAMFAALSGAAVALPGSDTVNSGDIVDETVKARDMKTASIKADEVGDGITGASHCLEEAREAMAGREPGGDPRLAPCPPNNLARR